MKKRGALFQYDDEKDLFEYDGISISSKNHRLRIEPTRRPVKRKQFTFTLKSAEDVARAMNPDWKSVVKASYNKTFVKDNKTGVWENRLKNHLVYISRDSAGLDGEPPVLFDEANDDLSLENFVSFAEPVKNEKYHFRLILTPEANEKIDLMAATREIVSFIEYRQDVCLNWAAAIHRNTGTPHVHLIIRGVDDESGEQLRIKKSLFKTEIREHLTEWINEMYGQKTLSQMIQGLDHEVRTANISRFDRRIDAAIEKEKRKNPYGYSIYFPRSEWEERRLRVLEKKGYAVSTIRNSARAWKIRNDFIERLKEDEKKIDIIKQQVKGKN